MQARQALVVAPNRPDVFLLLGEVYESLGQVAEAEGAFTSAVTVVGLDTSRKANQYRARLASFLAQRGEMELAVRVEDVQVNSGPPEWVEEMGQF